MLVALERVGRAEHDQNGKHVPLQLEPAIGAVTERVADHRVSRADDTGGQHQKITDVTYLFVDQVDDRANRQQWAHGVLPGGRHQGTRTATASIASPRRAERAEPWLICSSDCKR